jgi:hypothetical protein
VVEIIDFIIIHLSTDPGVAGSKKYLIAPEVSKDTAKLAHFLTPYVSSQGFIIYSRVCRDPLLIFPYSLKFSHFVEENMGYLVWTTVRFDEFL